MSHQDQHVNSVRRNSVYLLEAFQWLMAGARWDKIKLRDECTWTPRWIVAAGLLWAWSNENTLGERFRCSRRLVAQMNEDGIKPAGSYQAFLKLLCRWTGTLVPILQRALQQRMQSLDQSWKLFGLVVFGMDGSRVDLPRTQSNQRAYAPSRSAKRKQKTGRGKQRRPSRQKHAEGPQFWLTTIYHLGLQLPWDWRSGPSNGSERADVQELLPTLPDGALLCGDAGFVGYDFACKVLSSGHSLLIRVGSNVKLLKKLGYARESATTVYLWPDKVSSRSEPPLAFRHVTIRGLRHPIHLIVHLQAGQTLSDKQVAEIYRARWGVEVFYRHFKQTFQRRKLRSHAAHNAHIELQWSLVGLWSVLLYASQELDKQGIPINQLSVAESLRAFRQIARDYYHPANPRDTLRQRLRRSLIDTYNRKQKSSRSYPTKKSKRTTGPPSIKNATAQQQEIAKKIPLLKYG